MWGSKHKVEKDGQLKLKKGKKWIKSGEVYLVNCKEVKPRKVNKDKAFSFVILPDTQYYTTYTDFIVPPPFDKERGVLDIYSMQGEWIKKNRTKYNIRLVSHMGDITQDNAKKQWEVVKKAHKIFKDKVLTTANPGDHDYNVKKYEKRSTTKFNKYFKHMVTKKRKYVYWKKNKPENNYVLFTACKIKFLVLCLEHGPRKKVLKWASDVIKKYNKRKVIICTHYYLKPNGKRKADIGEGIYKKLVKPNENVLMVMGGHRNGSVIKKHKKRPLVEMLTNYQSERKSNERFWNSGNGWLRLVTFRLKKGEIKKAEFRSISVIKEGNTDCHWPCGYQKFHVKGRYKSSVLSHYKEVKF